MVVAAVASAVGPFVWNAILRDAGGNGFFVDAPVAVMPASWQDTGSGVFAAALSGVALGSTVLRASSGRRVALAALVCGLAAFLVDVYLY